LPLALLCAAVPAYAWIYLPESIRDYTDLPPNPREGGGALWQGRRVIPGLMLSN
jgi:hypothetical protein